MELDADGPLARRSAVDAGGDLDAAGARGVVVAGLGEDVLQVDLRIGEELNVAGDARLPPLVLVFQGAAVRPLDDLDGKDVAAGLADLGDVELAGQARVLAHADGDAVDPDGTDALDGAEAQDQALSGPLLGHGESGAVEAGGIGLGHGGRLAGPGHLDVGVPGLAVTLHGPAAGDRDVVPGPVVEVGTHEVGRR